MHSNNRLFCAVHRGKPILSQEKRIRNCPCWDGNDRLDRRLGLPYLAVTTKGRRQYGVWRQTSLGARSFSLSGDAAGVEHCGQQLAVQMPPLDVAQVLITLNLRRQLRGMLSKLVE